MEKNLWGGVEELWVLLASLCFGAMLLRYTFSCFCEDPLQLGHATILW